MAMKKYQTGLIGYPLGHSYSPVIHQKLNQRFKIDGEYHLYPLEPLPQGEERLLKLLNQFRQGELHGLNVTIPHKQKVMPYLDRLTGVATDVGAVNTIFFQDGYLIGDNTDVGGFLSDLKSYMPDQINSALIMGAGGAARAAAYGLTKWGCQLFISARRIEQAERLAADMATVVKDMECDITPIELSCDDLSDLPSGLDLIVNATPLGMAPNVNASPWPDGLSFPKGVIIYDLVYNPSETKLTHDAKLKGIPAYTGLGMLVEQASIAFSCWTDVQVSREMTKELLKEII